MKLFDVVKRVVGKASERVEKAVEAVLDVPFSRGFRNPAWVDGKIRPGDRIVGRQVVAPDMETPPHWDRLGGSGDEWDIFWNGNR